MGISASIGFTISGKAVTSVTASEKLVQHLHLDAHSGVAVHNPSNMFYLTQGYSGEGVVFISGRRRVIITDFRYTEQAERQAPDFEVVMVDKGMGHNQWLARLCQEEGITSLRYEDDTLTVRQFAALQGAVDATVEWTSLGGAPQELRAVKTEAEAAIMRKAAAITSAAFDVICGKIREGMTEKELQVELDFTMLKLGADGISFDTIIASGENGSLCHAIPGARKLQKGDMITMDYGAKFDGYCSDMTRTVALGTPSDTMRRVYDTVLYAQQTAQDALAPGKICSDIDKIARDYIDQQGYAGRFGHGLGHGVGIDIHENPRLSFSCHEVLVPGMVVTVEPGVYLPGVGGVRIENTCLITENGAEALTTAPRHLITL